MIDQATISGRAGLSVDDVRSALAAWTAPERGIMRMDRPLRDVLGGRHFHVAAPERVSGTLEVNFEPGSNECPPRIRVCAREHWRGTMAGGAQLRLVEHRAVDVGA